MEKKNTNRIDAEMEELKRAVDLMNTVNAEMNGKDGVSEERAFEIYRNGNAAARSAEKLGRKISKKNPILPEICGALKKGSEAVMSLAMRICLLNSEPDISLFEKFFIIADSAITASGKPNGKGGYDVGWSGIVSALIKEAGTLCDHYASDIFIDCMGIQKELESGEVMEGLRLFGFRESGVDGNDFILAKLRSPQTYGKFEYKSIWGLRISISNDGSVEMTLKKLM